MERNEIIDQAEQPADWVSFLVIVENPYGRLQLCLHPHDLMKAMIREQCLTNAQRRVNYERGKKLKCL